MLLRKTGLFALSFLLGAEAVFAYQLPQPEVNSKVSDNIRILRQISAGVSELSEEASKGVAFISVSKIVKGRPYYELDPFDFFFGPRFRQPAPNAPSQKQQAGVGSGFIVDLAKGYIITNNHVIEEADEISVKLDNGETYEAKVLGRDQNTDVAVVQIKDQNFNRNGLTQLYLGDSDKVKVGEFVIALGAPFGLEFSQSFGAISAVSRGNLNITNLGNFIQTDAAINPGNSGGPLINMDGQVIGMNTAIFSRSGGSAGIGFAVPSALVRNIADQLVLKGKVSRGYLGVRLAQDLDDDLLAALNLPKGTQGALVANVEKGTPAARAGLESGDVITEVNNKTVKTNQDLTNTVGLLPPNTKVSMTYFRNGKAQKTTVTLGDFDQNPMVAAQKEGSGGGSPAAESSSGLKLETLSKQKHAPYIEQFGIESNAGLLVVDVDQGSKAFASGIRPGDVLLRANQTALKSVKDFNDVFKSSGKILIQLERRGTFLFASIRK
jgi:serine protease Do